MSDALDFLKEPEATPEDRGKEEAPAETPPEAPPEPSSNETISVEGKEYKVSEVLEWKAGSMKAADYSQKTMAVAERDRELSAKEQEIVDREARLAELEKTLSERTTKDGNSEAQPDFSGLNEVAAGLGDAFKTVFQSNAELRTEIKTVRAAQEKAEADAAKYLEDVSADDAMDRALDQFKNDPFANVDDIRALMEARGLGPENADLAYEGLYGFRKGEAKTEAAMRQRKADVPAPMGPSKLGIQGGSPAEVVGKMGTEKSLRKTSFQEVRDRAKHDPTAPKVAFDG
jgi:hypothetical protein